MVMFEHAWLLPAGIINKYSLADSNVVTCAGFVGMAAPVVAGSADTGLTLLLQLQTPELYVSP
jgi:hypothetical protein